MSTSNQHMLDRIKEAIKNIFSHRFIQIQTNKPSHTYIVTNNGAKIEFVKKVLPTIKHAIKYNRIHECYVGSVNNIITSLVVKNKIVFSIYTEDEIVSLYTFKLDQTNYKKIAENEIYNSQKLHLITQADVNFLLLKGINKDKVVENVTDEECAELFGL